MMAAFGILISFCALVAAFIVGVVIGMMDDKSMSAADRRGNKAAGWFFICLTILLWLAGLVMVW